MTNRMERKDIEEEDRKFIGDSRFGGRSNWDTYETTLVLDSDERTQRQIESASENFNRKLRAGDFDMDKAEMYVKKYLIPEARKVDPDIDPSKVNTRELVREIVQMNEPLPPRKIDYVPSPVGIDYQDSYIKEECERRNMEYVPGYRKSDGTLVQAYCRHTKYTEFMKKYGRK